MSLQINARSFVIQLAKLLVSLSSLLFIVIAQARPANAQIFPDPYNTGGTNSASISANSGLTSLQWVHSTASRTNRLLLVGVSINSGQAPQPSVSSIIFGPLPLSRYGSAIFNSPSGNLKIELWVLLNPPPLMTDTITVTLSGPAAAVGGSASFGGVNQTMPLGTFDSNSGTGSQATVSVSSSPGDLIMDVLADSFIDGTPSSVPGQAEQWNTVSGTTPFSDLYGASSTTPTAEAPKTRTVTVWQLGASTAWLLGGVSIKHAAVPTLIHLDSFTASHTADGVLLQWQTGLEVNNLGFHLYREAAGTRTRVTPQLLAGSALLAGPSVNLSTGSAYSWIDSTPLVKGVRYWLEEMDLNGQSVWHGPISVETSSAPSSLPRATKGRSLQLNQIGISDGRPDSVLPLERRDRPAEASAATRKIQADLAARSAIKISIKHEGWYSIPQPDLIRAGLDPNIDPRLLQLFVDGRQLPIKVRGEKNGRLDPSGAVAFYGIGLDSAATDLRAYWLVVGAEPGLRIEQVKGKGSRTESSSFPYTIERKDRTVYFSGLRNGEQENFFGALIGKDPVEQSLTIQHLDRSSGGAVLEVALQGVTNLAHKVRVELNGSEVGELSFTGQAEGVAKLSLPPGLLKNGENVVRLVALGAASDTQADISLVDYLRLTHPHVFTADDDALRFTLSARQRVTIGGFTNAAIHVLDVTDPQSVQEIPARIEPSSGGGFAVTVSGSKESDHLYVALAENRAMRPALIEAAHPTGLRQAAQSADMIILTHRDFVDAVKPLRDLRQSQGLTVAVVDIEAVFNAFSFGNKNPQAIKDFLAYTRSSWEKAPRFVMLVGDASIDPKNYLGRGDFDLLPTKLIDITLMETASDSWLADFDGDGIEDLALGRLPARTVEEAAAMVGKIVAYDRAIAPKGVLLVADDIQGYDFAGANAQLRQFIPPDVQVEELNRGGAGDATRSRLIAEVNQGKQVVSYFGHGSVNLWRGNLLTDADATALNNDGLPVFVMMTCLNGYFQDPQLDSLAESLMKAQGRGAVAAWASSGITQPEGQSQMSQQFYRLLFNGAASMTLGEASAKAKAVADGDIRRTWILFGDPSMKLR